MTKYNLVVCGGTFDLFHKGHKKFINQILNKSDNVILGLTSDSFARSFKSENEIEKFKVRKKEVERFLDSIGARDRVNIVQINDIYGPLLTKSIHPQAIVVTSQTEKTAVEINQKRKEKQLSELEMIVLPMELAEDGKIISSTRIRNGEINRDGRLYLSPKWQNKKLILPLGMRSVLQRPMGEVLRKIPKGFDSSKIITIGDVTTQEFNRNNANQFLSIVDFLVQRQKKFNALSELGFTGSEETLKIKKPPGTINPELFKIVKKIFQAKNRKTKVILIKGEEDLSVLPVLLVAPLGFSIFYGQPGQGLVRVRVDEENKEKAYKLVDSFISGA